MFTVTKEWLESNATAKVGWTRAQLKVLKVWWPPRKGWLSRLVRSKYQITDDARAEFERLGAARRRSLAKDALMDWADSVPVERERPF